MSDQILSAPIFKDNTDPAYVGPGIWTIMHILAFAANDIESQSITAKTIKDMCYNFPCPVCRSHAATYIYENPPELLFGTICVVEELNIKEYLGLFLWTWQFHNAVNFRLQKPIMNWSTAYNLYNSLK